MAQAFCDRYRRPIWPWLKQIMTPKRDCLKTDKYENKTNIKESLTYVSLCVCVSWRLKILALCREHPKQGQNPKFTLLSETTSIRVCFIWMPPPYLRVIRQSATFLASRFQAWHKTSTKADTSMWLQWDL